MAIQPEQVKKIAYLARLRLSADHAARLTQDLGQILSFVDQMQNVDTASIKPLSNPLESYQPLRPDRVTEKNQRDILQSVSPATEGGLFLVPRVIE